jgi:hypothetical protein
MLELKVTNKLTRQPRIFILVFATLTLTTGYLKDQSYSDVTLSILSPPHLSQMILPFSPKMKIKLHAGHFADQIKYHPMDWSVCLELDGSVLHCSPVLALGSDMMPSLYMLDHGVSHAIHAYFKSNLCSRTFGNVTSIFSVMGAVLPECIFESCDTGSVNEDHLVPDIEVSLDPVHQQWVCPQPKGHEALLQPRSLMSNIRMPANLWSDGGLSCAGAQPILVHAVRVTAGSVLDLGADLLSTALLRNLLLQQDRKLLSVVEDRDTFTALNKLYVAGGLHRYLLAADCVWEPSLTTVRIDQHSCWTAVMEALQNETEQGVVFAHTRSFVGRRSALMKWSHRAKLLITEDVSIDSSGSFWDLFLQAGAYPSARCTGGALTVLLTNRADCSLPTSVLDVALPWS